MEFWQAIARTEVDQLVPVACLAEKLGFRVRVAGRGAAL